MVRGREKLWWERKLGELGLFSLGRGRLGVELIALYKYIQGVNTREGEELMQALKDSAGTGGGAELPPDTI